MTLNLIQPFAEKFADYLSDESKMRGQALSISFPDSPAAVAAIIREMAVMNVPVTVQGGKTGICGGAVPLSGHVMNLSGLNKINGLRQRDDGYEIIVQAGVRLDELKRRLCQRSFATADWDEESLAALAALRQESVWFWPPEPTETSATIGGILATNARGICAYLYGDTRQYVTEIVVVDSCGEEITLRRGDGALDHQQRLTAALLIENADDCRKMTDSELLDLYLGSEGLYGIIVAATLRLRLRPREVWGVSFFFLEQSNLFRFAEALQRDAWSAGSASIAAMEYLDRRTLAQIGEFKKVADKLPGLPAVSEKYAGMIYIELHGEAEGDIEKIAERLLELAGECGCGEEDSWALSGFGEIAGMHQFRHAAPESVNMALAQARRSDARIMKLATDLTVPQRSFGETVTMYQQDGQQSGLDIVIFGHVADNHLHVNFLPRDYDEYETGKQLIANWTLQSVQAGGVAFGEHGVGKIKRELFRLVTTPAVFAKLRRVKQALDPLNRLNRGTRFDE